MKKLLLILLVISVATFLMSCEHEDVQDIPNDDIMALGPVYTNSEHRQHTHEHPGSTGCCPCGVCHKHDDEQPNEELSIWTRIISGLVGIAFLIKALHEVLPIIF